MLVEAGSGVATQAIAGSAGVPESVAATTIVLPFNDLTAVTVAFAQHADRIAAVIVEPVGANTGVIAPDPGLPRAPPGDHAGRAARSSCSTRSSPGSGSGRGGAQARFGVRPDLTTLGKIIGGGMPIGAYGGRADLMALVAPAGPVYQAGTLSGHPLSMAAGIATLAELTPQRYVDLEDAAATLAAGLADAAAAAGCVASVARVGPLLTVFFRAGVPVDAADALASDRAAFSRFFGSMLDQGVLLPPSPFEAWFPSMAHGRAEIDATLAAAVTAFREAAA